MNPGDQVTEAEVLDVTGCGQELGVDVRRTVHPENAQESPEASSAMNFRQVAGHSPDVFQSSSL